VGTTAALPGVRLQPVTPTTSTAASTAPATLNLDIVIPPKDCIGLWDHYERMSHIPDKPSALVLRDLATLWHPCTQMKDHEREIPLIPIRRGRGAWLEAMDGKRYLDAISSWWVNLFGHANPAINAAVAAQLAELEHVIFAGFTHKPAIEVAEGLLRVAPPGLARCFLADNGSAAVEVAVKMSFHYWRNAGQPGKKRFITLSNSYHGETLGALAGGNGALYKDIYAPLLMDVITAPSPDAREGHPGESAEQVARRQIGAMRELLTRHAHETAAVIIEPLVQCAAGMRMHHPEYLTLLRQACDEFGVHLIADEIAVGFGRTGTLFACEQGGITPDFLCLSKGLTGGYLPLSAVLTTADVYEAFYAEHAAQRAFLHSHSYTGNPLACAAARATLAIFADEPVLERNRVLAAHMASATAALADLAHVGEVRQTGMILAIEMVKHKASREPFGASERRGLRVYRHALERGALLRPIGNVIYFMPPYVITPEEIDFLADVAHSGIEAATCD
jgi:adenosylmethionine-8-amino-7-oxononanoate aminotransferase